MSRASDRPEKLSFSVGGELAASALLLPADCGPVLDALVAGGFGTAVIRGEGGSVIDHRGNQEPEMSGTVLDRRLLVHEGETIAVLEALHSESVPAEQRTILLDMAQAALHAVMRAAARRLLTTELHTDVVNQSYEELLAVNEDLRRSEARYRDLAASLEQQVAERSAELKRAAVKMLKQDRQAAIGQLAAGMAHEVNNPIGFVLSNLRSLSRYMTVIADILAEYRDLDPDHLRRMKERKIDFMLDDIPLLLRQSISGGERIQAIVAALKNFSHIDEVEMRDVDINAELDNVCAIAQHEIAVRSARISRDYQAMLHLDGNGAHLAQAFLNILMNALQSRSSGVSVAIKTVRSGGRAVISFSDDGAGIEPDVLQRIFDPFFTTRDVGAGVGLGLSVAYDIITAHGGTIEVASSPGEGTTVMIKLPVMEAANG